MSLQNHLPSICTEKNITESRTYLDIQRKLESSLKPGQSHVSDFANLEVSPDGRRVVGVAAICDDLKSSPKNRLAVISLDDGELEMFGSRKGSDSYPKWSPDGRSIAFVSAVGNYSQLHLLNLDTKEIKAITNTVGLIQNLAWSPDGAKVLLHVAGMGAETSLAEGGTTLSPPQEAADESWMPEIEKPPSEGQYRTIRLYDVATGQTNKVSTPGLNFWEAVWSSNSTIAGICSELPGEEEWYSATLRLVDLERPTVEELFAPANPNSLEEVRASPAGSRTAVVTGVASDRRILWGDLYIHTAGKSTTKIDTAGVDIGCMAWSSEDDLIAAGARGLEEVIIHYNAVTGQTRELWKSNEESIGPLFKGEISACKSQDGVECVFVRSGFFKAPALVHLSKHGLRVVKKFGTPEMEDKLQEHAYHEAVEWKAPDGQRIQGHFLAPRHPGPHPTILNVHGGPMWLHRSRYIDAIGEDVPDRLFLEAGFAIFKPNPRGSFGGGQHFVRQVHQDMGGADTHDFLSGIDALVESGRADAQRLAVYGVSYGGYMACWLVTQTDRFKAAVPVVPISNWVSEHYTSVLGKWIATIVGDDPHDHNGKYFTRSPLHHARKATTPTLLVCGAKDIGCPPTQASEFHNALTENGVASVTVRYPEEGHGIRHLPAFVDFSARTIEWFKHFV